MLSADSRLKLSIVACKGRQQCLCGVGREGNGLKECNKVMKRHLVMLYSDFTLWHHDRCAKRLSHPAVALAVREQMHSKPGTTTGNSLCVNQAPACYSHIVIGKVLANRRTDSMERFTTTGAHPQAAACWQICECRWGRRHWDGRAAGRRCAGARR